MPTPSNTALLESLTGGPLVTFQHLALGTLIAIVAAMLRDIKGAGGWAAWITGWFLAVTAFHEERLEWSRLRNRRTFENAKFQNAFERYADADDEDREAAERAVEAATSETAAESPRATPQLDDILGPRGTPQGSLRRSSLRMTDGRMERDVARARSGGRR